MVGVLAPVYGAFGYFHYDYIKKGANLTCSILVDMLLRMLELGAQFGREHTLNIQADNATDNKNYHLLALLCFLVEQRAFKAINLNFLMVGHTHEDVDQMFKCFSSKLRKNDAITMDELQNLYLESYHSNKDKVLSNSCRNPRAYMVKRTFNYKKWTSTFTSTLKGITQPHCFNIEVSI